VSRAISGGGLARRAGIALALAGLLAALAAGARSEAQDGSARGPLGQPNVLVVLTDDQRYSDLATANPRTLRRIGRRGVQFRQAFATIPLCCPSRASYLTGRYAHNHGVLGNEAPNGGWQAFDDSATTAVALDAAGYETGWVGKYLNGYLQGARLDPPYVPPGYDFWRAGSATRVLYGWEQVIGNRRKFWGNADRDYQNDVYARQAEKFVESAADSGVPFFLTVSPLSPHVETRGFQAARNPRPPRRHRDAFKHKPLPRPPAMNEADISDKPSFVSDAPRLKRPAREIIRDLNRDRLGSLLAVDDLVVRVMAALRRNGMLEETLVIFTSDNGYLLGEHRLTGKSKIYDEATRVPLLMRGPGLTPGTVVDSPVANFDVASTIYDFTGVQPAQEQDGVSLFDVAATPGVYSDRELVIQTNRGFALRTPDWLYAEHETDLGTEYELYDLQQDPYQLDSRHDDPEYAGIRVELADRLDELDDCEGAECH
jgi:arylsulfatase A-like enzyme